MTQPFRMNCEHSENGWCLLCVRGLAKQVEDLQAENKAWKERFPEYKYRSQDECVELK